MDTRKNKREIKQFSATMPVLYEFKSLSAS